MTNGDARQRVIEEPREHSSGLVVQVSESGLVVGVLEGGPDNAVLFPIEHAAAVGVALIELATQEAQDAGHTATKGDMASVRVLVREAARQGRGMHLNPLAVQALAGLVDRQSEEESEELKAGRRALTLLGDLDRCEHGRHHEDRCFDCPGGKSSGNLVCPPGTLVGHNYVGLPLVMPEQADRIEPKHWRS